MALTTASRFSSVYITYTFGLPIDVTANPDPFLSSNYVSINIGRGAPESGTQDATDLGILQEIYGSTDGFRDADGNSITVIVRQGPDGITDADDLEINGHLNPLSADSYERVANLKAVFGTFLQAASVEEDSDTGRRDISIEAGFIPTKRTSNSGAVQQSLEDWTASNVSGRLRVTIYALAGEQFDGTDLIADDPRIHAMALLLEANRTSGSAINFASGITLSTFHASLAGRNFTLDQDISSTTNNLVMTLSSSGRDPGALNLSFTITSGNLSVSLMNELLANTTVSIETEDAIEEPPFGNIAVRLKTERIEFANGQFVSERGIPTWRVEGRSHPMGGSYGKTIRLHNLILHDDGYHYFPWDDRETVYDLRAVHIEDSLDVVVRLGAYDEMAASSGSQFSFDIHNANDHGGATVKVEDADGNDFITLLPQETFSVVTEQFTNGNGEIRSGQRIPRPLEVTADDLYAVMNDQGYWEASSAYWARAIPMPASDERASSLVVAEDVFEFGTATIANGTNITADAFNLHIPESIKLKKADGRLRYRLAAGVRAKPGTSGTHAGHIRLWRQRGGAGTNPITLINIPHGELGSEDEQYWVIEFSDEGEHIEADDVLCAVDVYAKSSSRNPSNIEFISFSLTIYLDEEIVREYTA